MNEDDDAGFLDAIEDDNKAPALEPEPVQDPAPEPQPEPIAEPAREPVTEQPKPEAQTAPISALLDERDKRKALEAELAQYRAKQQQPQAQVEVPDVLDPEYPAYINKQIEDRLFDQTVKISHRFAVQQHGEEVTKEAIDWAFAKCDADPIFNQQVKASGDPVGFAVSQYQRDKIVSAVTPSDFEQFQAWKAAQSAIQEPTAVPKAPPPRSLASAPSAGGVLTEVEPTEEEIFEAVAKRK